MKVRTSLIIGFAAGYVMGAKAGRERYEQIRKVTNTIANNPPIRRVLDDTRELADAGSAKTRIVVSDQIRTASEALRAAARS